jgi:hypothetical protein
MNTEIYRFDGAKENIVGKIKPLIVWDVLIKNDGALIQRVSISSTTMEELKRRVEDKVKECGANTYIIVKETCA